MRLTRLLGVLGVGLLPLLGNAQDSRKVSEPRVPAACVVLEAEIAAKDGVVADADERRPDTARIQQAMDRCEAGKAVVLRAKGGKTVFVSGPLELRTGVTLVVDANTVLSASRDPRLYDLTPGSCGLVSDRGHGCKPFLSASGAQHSGVMGQGAIDGRGGAKLLGQKESWWDLAREAKIVDKQQNVPWLMILHKADDFTMYQITLRNSPGFHVAINETDGFTAWGVKILTPATARNSDGIDPGSSRNVTIAYSYIYTGDDNVAIKSGAAGPSSNISVLHNHFYTGHGMSIGSGTSGGVDHMLVEDLTIDGADNGLRIKSDRSRGGLVHDIVYRDVCIRNVPHPLVFTTLYTTFTGNLIPDYRAITLDNVRVLTPGYNTFFGTDADHKIELKLNNVFVDDQKNTKNYVRDANFTIGERRGNFEPGGERSSIQQSVNSEPGTARACEERFVAFPKLPTAPELHGTVLPEDKTFYVANNGSGDYYSIQRAIEEAPKEGAVILVAPGTYREVLTIDKPHIRLRSHLADASKTVIVNDRSAASAGGTLKSATVNVLADDFYAENITIENDYNRTHEQLQEGSQAVALRTIGDRGVYRNVRLLGNQDTLYAGSRNCSPDGANCIPTRQYFSHCVIAGNVDFIFGDGKAVFEDCEIRSTAHAGGFITAQSKHYPDQDSGFVFDRCKLTADAGLTGRVYLGRPWRVNAMAVFLNTEMGAHIDAEGWSEWHGTQDRTLEGAYYAEFQSSGPGAVMERRNARTHLLNAEEAKRFAAAVFLRGNDNWNPAQAMKELQEMDKPEK